MGILQDFDLLQDIKGRKMFVTPAFAQGTGIFGGSDMLTQLLPFVLIFVIMYFLILRPQQKRAKEHQELVKNLRRGDTVITSGGLVGKVTKVVDDEQIEVEIADGAFAQRASRSRTSRAERWSIAFSGEAEAGSPQKTRQTSAETSRSVNRDDPCFIFRNGRQRRSCSRR